jgi:hypothetical protein
VVWLVKDVKDLHCTTAAEILFLSWLLGKVAIHKQDGGHLRNRKARTNTPASKADDSACTVTPQRNQRCSDMRQDITGELRHEQSVLTHGNSSHKQTQICGKTCLTPRGTSVLLPRFLYVFKALIHGTRSSSRH